MRSKQFKWWRIAAPAAAMSVSLWGCDLNTEPGTVFSDTPVDVTVVQGAGAADTIESVVTIRVALVPKDNEAPRPVRLRVTFSVLGEDCGSPGSAFATSDENDQVSTTWIFGSVAQECTMEIRALAPSSTLLGLTRVDATVEPGQPVTGWLASGNVARDVDTLVMEAADYPLEDRFANLLAWRFEVVNGPAVVLGQESGDDRSRTLVATGEGSGEVDVVSSAGTFLRAAFDVCTSSGQRWMRVFRPEDSAMVLAACP